MSAVTTEESRATPRPGAPGRTEGAARLALPVGLVALAGAVRLAYLLSDRAGFNGDEAVTGITAHRILHGEIYWFYPGQQYGGTLETYLQALSFLVLRMPENPVTLRLTQVALSMVTTALVYLCARRMLPARRQAVFAAAFYAVAPWFNVLMGVTSLGFYLAGQLAGMAALYCALRLGEGRWRDVAWGAALGLAGGLGFWNSLTSVYLLLPALIWAVPHLLRRIGALAAAVVGFGVGAAPALALMVRTHGLPVPDPGSGPSPSLVQRAHNLIGPVLREFLGITYPHATGGLPRVVQYLVVLALFAAFLASVWRRRTGLAALLTFRRDRREPIDLLIVTPALIAALYVSSPQAWYTGTPRYLVSAYPLLGLWIAAVLPWRRPRWSLVAYAAVVGLSAVLCVGFFRPPPSLTVAQRNVVLRQVVARLVAAHETRVYAGYWTAMPLQYLAGDRLQVAVCGGVARFPDTQARVARDPHPVYLDSPLAGNGRLTDPADAIHAALVRTHATFRTTQVGFVRIYDNLAPAAPAPQVCG